MIGGIIAAVTAAIAAITSGAIAGDKAAKEKERAKRGLTKRETWFNNNRYKNILNTDETRDILNTVGREIDLNNKALDAQSSIMGINANQTAQRKEEASNNYANAIGQIQSDGEKEKDAAVEKFLNANNNYASQLAKSESETADAIGTAVTGTLNSVGSLLSVDGVLP